MRRLLITTLLLVPSLALAQRGGGGRTQADRKTDLMDKDDSPKGVALRTRDVEDVSPLKLLIDKRKDLKLTDAQLAQLKDADGKLKEKNQPLMKALDSLIHESRAPGVLAPDKQQEVMRGARNGLMEVMKDVRANYDAAAKDAVAQLDAEQQPKANEMLEKQRQDAEKMLRERMGGGGGGRPGSGERL
jgi:hypothetical protein